MNTQRSRKLNTPHRGMTLVEFMVAITIGVMFLLAMGALFLSFKRTSQSQSGIAQLQDDQRMAMTILSQIIQSAGYFPNQASSTLSAALPSDSTTISGVSFSAGQMLQGAAGSASSVPDTLYIRYQTAQNDGVINCQGGSNASAGTMVYINQLSVASSTLQMTCGLNGAAAVGLIGGVNASASASTPCTKVGYLGISNIKFLYGMDVSGSGSVTQYASAGAVTNWANVYSVQSTITQLYCAQQGALPQSISFSRIVFLPNQAGS